jgi:hypothetical protein
MDVISQRFIARFLHTVLHEFSPPSPQREKERKKKQARKKKQEEKETGLFYSHFVQILLCSLGKGIYGP